MGILQRAARLPGKQGVDEDQTMPVGLVDLGEQIIDVGGWLSQLTARPHAANEQLADEIRLHGGFGADLSVAVPR